MKSGELDISTVLLTDYCSALLVGRSRGRSPVVSLGIFSVVPSDKTMCPEVDSASGLSSGVKGAGAFG